MIRYVALMWRTEDKRYRPEVTDEQRRRNRYLKLKRWRERNKEARNAMRRESYRRKAEREGRTVRPYRRDT